MKRPFLRHPPLAIETRCDGNQVGAYIGGDPHTGCWAFGDTLPDALRALADTLEDEVGGPTGSLDPLADDYVGHAEARRCGAPCVCGRTPEGKVDSGLRDMDCPWHGR